MALWQSSFADSDQQKCATRLLKAWGGDLCPTCMGEILFDHRCDPHDIAIAKHTDTVRNVLRSTQLLDTIQSAHAYNRDSTEQPEPISMGPNFFLDAEGHSEKKNNDLNEDSRTTTPQKTMTTPTAQARTLTRLTHLKTRMTTRNDGFSLAGGEKANETSRYV
jgi:hypothetical protein